jgi:UDP-2,3-diacylglucosamine hydrolase
VATAPTLFVSDLHLSRDRPELVEAFHAFVAGPARGASALYVPGDLFDAWLGDDQLREPLAAGVASAFDRLAASGTPVYLQRGNRDFLLGEHFARASGATLLDDAVVHDVQGTATLVMHGDVLCTDDVDYQRFRAYWQVAAHRRRLLALPYFVRRGIAAFFRATSRRAIADKPEMIMDVNADAVSQALRAHGVSRLIHGHTHRPARHELTVEGRLCERFVLADWYKTASYLRVDRDSVTACSL